MRILFLMFVILVMLTGMLSEQQTPSSQAAAAPGPGKTGGMQKISLDTSINTASCGAVSSQVALRNTVIGSGSRTIVLDMKDLPTMNINIQTKADGSAIVRWVDGKSSSENQMTLEPGQTKTISVGAPCTW